jgi:arylsulfatase
MSMLPLFENKPWGHEALYWEHEGNRAVRQGKWKLVSEFPHEWELYDLENDRTELSNLAGDYPQKVKQLANMYEEWAAKSNVLPWDEIEVSKIPTGLNPLLRDQSMIH